MSNLKNIKVGDTVYIIVLSKDKNVLPFVDGYKVIKTNPDNFEVGWFEHYFSYEYQCDHDIPEYKSKNTSYEVYATSEEADNRLVEICMELIAEYGETTRLLNVLIEEKRNGAL